jgi:hypothetical protein
VERALRCRDDLEDHYACTGVIAEAVFVKGKAVDIRFTFGNVNAAGRPRSAGYAISVYVPLAGRRRSAAS